MKGVEWNPGAAGAVGRAGARLNEHTASLSPQVPMVKKYYLDGGADPCMHVFDGGNRWNMQAPRRADLAFQEGRDWLLCVLNLN